MEPRSSQVSAAFPLARSSRRRRLALLSGTSPQHLEPERPRARHEPASTGRSVASATERAGTGASLTHTWAAPLAELLGQPESVTWMFSGGSGLPSGGGGRGWRSVVDHFTESVRDGLQRPADTIVDACRTECSLRDVRGRIESLVLKCAPDIVLLMFGSPFQPQAGLHRMEDDLFSVLQTLSRRTIVPVVNAPPSPWWAVAGDDPRAVDVLAGIEAVRAVAGEWDAPLVDHWDHWVQHAVGPGLPGSWYDADGCRPGAIGHARLAERIIDALALRELAGAQDVSPPSATSE